MVMISRVIMTLLTVSQGGGTLFEAEPLLILNHSPQISKLFHLF